MTTRGSPQTATSTGVDDLCDNCPAAANPTQADSDADGPGDACDACPLDATNDADGDGHCANADNCPAISNADQSDVDSDQIGDPCDVCPSDPLNDVDFDGICGTADNCPTIPNALQSDGDADGFGDPCDNCPAIANATQTNTDGDSAGDACDCAPSNANVYPGGPERNDGVDNNCPGEADYGLVDELSGTIGFFDPTNKHVLSWPAQPGATSYRVFRPPASNRSSPGCCFCTVATLATRTYLTTSPPVGWIYFYLVTGWTPFHGQIGRTSSGTIWSNQIICN
jgi:hypothetical protein